jgi:microcompartment protein CcmL/EutN
MMKTQTALALLELDSVPFGILTADAMLKEAPIAVLRAGTVHNGKYLILIGGSVAAVEVAFQKGQSVGQTHLLDMVFLPNVHPAVYAACQGTRNSCGSDALAVIEMATVSAILKSADAAVKGAGVDLVELRLADDLGGKALAIYAGPVEETETAAVLSEASLENREILLSKVIIPRIDAEIAGQINHSTYFSKTEAISLEQGE